MQTRIFSFITACIMLLAWQSKAQVSIVTLNVAYTDSFTSFTGSTDPGNWISSDATGTSIWQGQNTGSATTGGKYAYGTGLDVDYALGFLPTGSREVYVDIAFINNTGATITALDIAYAAEQWRSSNGGRVNGWEVSYDIGSTGSFTDVGALNYQAANTKPTGALDGNDAANRSVRSAMVGGLNIADGTSFTIRFFGNNGTGSGARQGIAIDEFSLTASGFVSAQAYTYNNAWDTDPSGISTANDTIHIMGGNADITANTSCHTLTIAPGASLNVDTAAAVEISGNAWIKADSKGYAQVMGTVSTTGAGVVYWQSYLNDGARWYNNAFATNGSTLSDVSGVVLNFTNAPATHNVYSYVESTANWDYASAESSTDNIAYQIYGSSNFGGVPATLQIQGNSIKNGTQNIVVSNGTDGFNYIPNPYPSVLDWKAVYSDYKGANALGNEEIAHDVIYVQTGTPNTSIFDTYNAATDVSTNNGSRYLAPGQGFFVQVGAAGAITFNNSVRTISQMPTLNKTTDGVYVVKLISADLATGDFDETVLAFGEHFLNGIDRSDGLKRLNVGVHNVYTEVNGEALVHNNRKSGFQSISQEVLFNAPDDGTFSLGVSALRVPDSWTLVLEDNFKGITTNLRQGSYTFKHLLGNTANRFTLHINKAFTGMGAEDTLQSKLCVYQKEDVLFVQLQGLSGVADIFLYDMQGSRAAQASMEGNRLCQLPLSNLAKGVYVLKVFQAGKLIHTQKQIR